MHNPSWFALPLAKTFTFPIEIVSKTRVKYKDAGWRTFIMKWAWDTGFSQPRIPLFLHMNESGPRILDEY